MKITVNYSKLAQALLYTSRSVSSKPNIPILSNVLIDSKDGGISLVATNLEMMIYMWIPGIVEEEGKTTVSAKYLSDFVSASKSDNVQINLASNLLKVTTEKSKASFNTIDPAEYPALALSDKIKLFTMDSEEFLNSMDKVLFACSTDFSISKIQQTGVYLEIKGEDEINFVGLDGVRLSMRHSKVRDLNSEVMLNGLIVPAKYFSEFSKIIQDMQEVVEIEFYLSSNKTQIIMKVEDLEFSIRLLEGTYPDYKKILPDSYLFGFNVSKPVLDNALKIANTFARGNVTFKTLFDLDLENSQVTLRSSVSEVGENESKFEVQDLEGETDFNSAYNLKLLQDIVNHVKSDTIRFETKSSVGATVFKDLKDSNFIHLLMPLRRE